MLKLEKKRSMEGFTEDGRRGKDKGIYRNRLLQRGSEEKESEQQGEQPALIAMLEMAMDEGVLCYWQREYAKAFEHFTNALEWGIQLKDRLLQLKVRSWLGLTCYHLGMVSQALYHCKKGLYHTAHIKGEETQLAIYGQLLCHRIQGNYNRLPQLIQQFYQKGKNQKAQPWMRLIQMRVKLIEAELLLQLGKTSPEELLNQIHELPVDPRNQGAYLLLKGKLYAQLGELNQAIALLQAYDTGDSMEDQMECWEISTVLAELFLEQGDTQQAVKYFQRAGQKQMLE